ncbi:hypothetical protein APV28_1726 [Comamonas testosteroni]|nr:hypothetical protein APV28_1726 [Comamonas testosteroni]
MGAGRAALGLQALILKEHLSLAIKHFQHQIYSESLHNKR